MLISIIIALLSYIVWICPIFRQRRSNLFPFFYMLGILSPLRIVLFYYGRISLITTEVPATFLILSSLLFFTKVQNIILSILAALMLYTISLFIPSDMIYLVKILIYTIIFFLFLKEAIFRFINQRIISIFYILLSLLTLSTVFKYVPVITDISTGEVFFYITTAFQLFIGIYFSIFKMTAHDIKIPPGKNPPE